jgi:hypothetical protein
VFEEGLQERTLRLLKQSTFPIQWDKVAAALITRQARRITAANNAHRPPEKRRKPRTRRAKPPKSNQEA